MLTHLLANWKSTANGVLAFLITTLTVLAGYYATSASPGAAKASAIIAIALSLCRAWVGMIEKDAGVTLAKVPGVAAPVAVESHEVPFNKGDKPVPPGKQ